MGGDNAPGEIVAGAVLAAREGLGHMLLVGDRAVVEPLLAQDPVAGIEIVHAPGAIAMDANPAQAVRNCDETSLGVAVNLVREGAADAVVSAGNSGAFLAIALVRLRTIAGVARPAIAVVYPAMHGPVVVLDSGANVDCRPEWLAQFGVMGSAYARAVLGIVQPKVGIISVGEERTKGNALTMEAARLLEQTPVNFIGNVEGKDVFVNVADVIVTDGFVGNVILKLSEGAVSLIGDIVVGEIKGSGLLTKLGALLVRPALRRVRDKLSYDNYGGAPLLGLRGNCIVAHGRANRVAVRSAIRAAGAEVREDVVGRIGELVVAVDAREAKEA
ncbi:MAG: phosphate acyltransferase PlsX [Candidatus Eremiobacteraeota bacterium]|nr:phosphate acyltransferase PlsX [Candidatus Eremiobacteraeota bacterium]